MVRMLSACLLALGLVAFLPAHEGEKEIVCDRLSVCIVCSGTDLLCFLPIPIPKLPGLG